MNHIIHYNPDLPKDLPTPCFVVDLSRLERNLEVLASVQEETGCHILCALKGFAMHSVFPLISRYLKGICASGLYEARLGKEFFGKEIHVYAPAYSEADLAEILPIADHISFNSLEQWNRFKGKIQSEAPHVSCGLRVNPEYSEVEVALYDPCSPGSRLGIRRSQLANQDLTGIDGLHFHTMCEQNSDTLSRTLQKFEEQFGDLFKDLKWVNFGGGHHITSPHYDRRQLTDILTDFRKRHSNLDVYLEPGEAIALNTGVLATSVLDIIENEGHIAILDTSATCHLPDTLEMPYRAEIYGASQPGEKGHRYRLGGMSCLAGDIFGEYSFDDRLSVGDRLYFLDMAHYTMVKTTMFNGVKHPSIATWDPETKALSIVREFGYEDYKHRLS